MTTMSEENVRESGETEGEGKAVEDLSEGESSGRGSSLAAAAPIPRPPTKPESGTSVLGHKIWIGNLDKRLTE